MKLLNFSTVATAIAALLFSLSPVDIQGAGKNKKKNNNNRNRPSAVRSSPSKSSNPRMQISSNRSPITSSSINRKSNKNNSNRKASNNSRPNNNNKKPSVNINRKPNNSSNNKPRPNNSAKNNKKPSNNNNRPNNTVVRKPAPTVKPKLPSNPRMQVNRVTPKPGMVKYPKVATTSVNRNNNHDNHNHGNRKNDSHANHNHNKHRSHRHPQRVSNVVRNTSVVNRWDNNWRYSNSVWRTHSDHNHDTRHSNHYHSRPISSNFQHAVNYAYRPTSWGSRPWWDSSSCHDWHRGSWNYGWNNNWQSRYSRYNRPSRYYPPGYYNSSSSGVTSALTWGLAGWTLGKLFYDTGYSTYSNPYSAPTNSYYGDRGGYSYSEPISVYAAEEIPESEEVALTNEEKSAEAAEASRVAFKQGDYLSALNKVDEAIAYETGDPALHEYRALTLFALGRYGDAAGVLNPVLASGPGWDWATMIGLYPNSDVYTNQLRKLESYVFASPDSADSHFVLGYHYMVGGFLEQAFQMFDRVTQLQPADSVARQLRNLAYNSLPNPEEEESITDPVEDTAEVVIVEPEALYGTWRSQSAEGKAIDLALTEEGGFSWKYEGAADSEVLSGEWSIDDDGFLVLADEDVQLVGEISLEGDHTMRFVLVGGPEGDPGLVFERL